jgi:hypothetical protein
MTCDYHPDVGFAHTAGIETREPGYRYVVFFIAPPSGFAEHVSSPVAIYSESAVWEYVAPVMTMVV